ISDLAAEIRARFALQPNHGNGPKPLSALIEELREPIAFYFDVGKYEPQFIPAHHRLVPLLEAKGCPCFFQELTGGHNWTSWRAHLKELLTFLWRDNAATISEAPAPLDERKQPAAPESASPTRDFDAFFNQVLGRWDRLFPGWLRPSGWDPSINVTLDGNELHFTIALPGFAPQDVEALIVGNRIVIQGKRVATQEQGFGLAFMNSNRFERTVPLPDGVNVDQVSARYHDGVLEITMPTPQTLKARRIPIDVQ